MPDVEACREVNTWVEIYVIVVVFPLHIFSSLVSYEVCTVGNAARCPIIVVLHLDIFPCFVHENGPAVR